MDIYDSTTHTWSTSSLSEAREELAATSVGNIVLFGGGENATVRTNDSRFDSLLGCIFKG